MDVIQITMTRLKYTTTIRLIAGLMFLLILSCENRDWDNPFDPDCPKESWTPTNFQAILTPYGVELTWTQPLNNISGFKLTKKVDTGTATDLASQTKDISQLIDNDLIAGKVYTYSIVAYAGNKESNNQTAQVTPALSVTTSSPTSITSDSAVLGGTITAIAGSTIYARGIKYWVRNSSSSSTINFGSGETGYFSGLVPNLTAKTTYIYQAYAINGQMVWAFGNELSFTTK
jgi:hypothetical protein